MRRSRIPALLEPDRGCEASTIRKPQRDQGPPAVRCRAEGARGHPVQEIETVGAQGCRALAKTGNCPTRAARTTCWLPDAFDFSGARSSTSLASIQWRGDLYASALSATSVFLAVNVVARPGRVIRCDAAIFLTAAFTDSAAGVLALRWRDVDFGRLDDQGVVAAYAAAADHAEVREGLRAVPMAPDVARRYQAWPTRALYWRGRLSCSSADRVPLDWYDRSAASYRDALVRGG